ncbi:MAG: Fic family protein [Oscillospiraceae bacterium]|jgi:cell filamentation protein|nr:Fic family protein [Oscillospiraceae bacterium]
MKYKYGGVEYEGDDFYCYPDSKVLMNRLDIRDNEELHIFERDISYRKMAFISTNPFKGSLDLKYLQKIHRFIFEDIYSWAGRIRGGTFFFKGEAQFCNADMIYPYAENIIGKLRKESWLRGLNREDFIRRIAYFMSEINTLHPFREGNGRTQRIFFTELARRARYELNFSEAQPDELLEADIAAYDKDFAPLEALLDKMLI